jgi:hypothetical protein
VTANNVCKDAMQDAARRLQMHKPVAHIQENGPFKFVGKWIPG